MFKLSFPECDANGGAEHLTEKHVQALWYDREMRPDGLAAIDGERVSVIDPGEWNLEAGPDFLGAVLEIGQERRRVCGDVEIHLRPGDWTAHRHGDDPAYRNVVAHVTWYSGTPPASLPPGTVSIPIGRLVSEQTGFSPEHIDLAAYPFSRISGKPPPCRELVGSSPARAMAVLSAAGARRLHTKASLFAAKLAESGADRLQILYEEIMAVLGYKRNARAFRSIARMLPLSALRTEPQIAEHAFMCASEFVAFDCRSTRPNNAPLRRLMAAANFFPRHSIEPLANIVSFGKADLRLAISLLTKDGLMGARRAAAVVTNAVVPMAIAEKRLAAAPPWLPPEDLSSPMRLTAMRLFGRDHNPSSLYLRNGLLMQGLLQIHREFCLELYPDCVLCAVSALGVA